WGWDPPRRVEGVVGDAAAVSGARYRVRHDPRLTCREAVTIAFWARVEGSSGAWQWPLQKNGRRRNYSVYFHRDNGRFCFSATFAHDLPAGFTDADSGFSAWDGRWHHYAATYSLDEGRVALYVDGALRVARQVDGGTLSGNEEDLVVGAGLRGALDEVWLYRRALSPAEVAALAQKQTPSAEGLVGWWPMEGDQTALRDRSGNRFHLQNETTLQRLTELARANGLTSLVILGFPPAWASTAPEGAARPWVYPPRLEAWSRYVEHTVRRYRDRVRHWEIWNEPNITVFWEPAPDPAGFFEVLKTGYEAAKRADPGCTVVMPGLAGPSHGGDSATAYLDALLERGAARYCDAISIHPYRQATPEASSLAGNLQHIARSAEKSGVRRPIWVTENCWTTQIPNGSSEERQARMLARAYVLSLHTGLVERLFWFRLHDSGTD
ncbi:MAG: glycosyl hydrolase, partial [Armatimonadota bacterium]|nr:glycosyl hydrolase [Armatimonadota bacterium]